MKKLSTTIIILFITMFFIAAQGQKEKSINWPVFMKDQALHWDSISTDYYSGMILGNGLLGTNIYKEDDHAIRFDVGRSDITDQRKNTNSDFTEILYTNPRLPIGRMNLKTIGKITGANMQLDIYDAEAAGTIYTDSGSINFKAFVVSDNNVIYIDAIGTGSEKNIQWDWVPEKSISPRVAYVKPKSYIENPPFTPKDTVNYHVCQQDLLNGGAYATVWQTNNTNNKSSMMIAVGWSAKGNGNPINEAINCIKQFSKTGYANVIAMHHKWWNDFYKKSFISLPDKRMESFYWAQLYKLASATRGDKNIIDLMGPWFTSSTPWPAIWWNLNVQLTYSPIYTANHLELGKPLNQSFNDNQQNLINNVPIAFRNDAAALGRISSYDLAAPLYQENQERLQFEPGNLTWALYYYYQHYIYTLDTAELIQHIYPMLKRSVSYMIHLLEPDSNNILHLPISASPEYKNAADANYSLACLKWGLQTLVDINRNFEMKDAAAGKWNDILKNLVPFPTGESGYMIGKDIALISSHRHFSHLMMIYPFHTINWEQNENRALISKSIEHWLSNKNALAGFSFSGASSLYASIGNGDSAYKYLDELLSWFIQPNTLYKESGPVIETPLSAATSIQEMLLQSWGGKLRIFPAIPRAWKDVSFDRLLAEGAFLISAKRENGLTDFIKVKSKKGGTCTLQTDMKNFEVRSDIRRNIKSAVTEYEGKRIIKINTLQGETISFFLSGKKAHQNILPVRGTINKNRSWGLKKTSNEYAF